MQKKYYIETYGCQMNISDSELVGSLLKGCNYNPTDNMSQADVVFLNTCAIREKAEDATFSSSRRSESTRVRGPKKPSADGSSRYSSGSEPGRSTSPNPRRRDNSSRFDD